MHSNPTWEEIALRLLYTLIGGALIGFNRGERGRTAGLRTTMLVCLAASVAMIDANVLFVTTPGDAQTRMDFMRLPLGILTGVGFIGAGAIFRKENMVIGVTTAATLWFVTVMGLCFGGGQVELGFATLGLGLFVLWALKWVEEHWKQERHATLTLATEQSEAVEEDICKLFKEAGYHLKITAVALQQGGAHRQLTCQLHWRGRESEPQPPPVIKEIMTRFAAVELDWQLQQS